MASQFDLDRAPVAPRGALGGVPVIDLSAPHDQVVTDIARACAEWGFFQVVGHGVPGGDLERVIATARAFFVQPRAVKRADASLARQSLGLLRPRADQGAARPQGSVRHRPRRGRHAHCGWRPVRRSDTLAERPDRVRAGDARMVWADGIIVRPARRPDRRRPRRFRRRSCTTRSRPRTPAISGSTIIPPATRSPPSWAPRPISASTTIPMRARSRSCYRTGLAGFRFIATASGTMSSRLPAPSPSTSAT